MLFDRRRYDIARSYGYSRYAAISLAITDIAFVAAAVLVGVGVHILFWVFK